MRNNWYTVKDNIPDLYDALGIELSENLLVCDIKDSSVTIASLWIMENDKHVWRDLMGDTVKPTHWQYIKLPKVTNDN